VVVWPAVAGVGEALAVVVVPALLTDWVTAGEVLAVNMPAPL
jgi:hypothetical protein